MRTFARNHRQGAVKIRKARKTAFTRDVGAGAVGRAHKLLRTFDPLHGDVFKRRNAVKSPENAAKISAVHAADRGKRSKRYFFGKMFFDIIGHTA